jgi:predicted naringenin-chalcone synthase
MRNNQDRQVDIIHTELLTLHHKTNDLTESDIYVMTLFSDGVIKYSARLENEYLDKSQPYLRVLAMHKQIIPNSSNEIEWSPGPFQFEMNLSAMVPRIIKRNVKTFVVELLMNAGINFDTEKDKLIFAIHPGGVKLVEHLQQALDIDDIQVAISKEIFFENGNMSSSTIPYILHRILFSENVENGKYIVSLAYGPGLTLAGAVMQKVCIT